MSILDNAANILRLIAHRQSGITMSDVAEQLALPKSTASRVLKQLTHYGFLLRDPQTLIYTPGLLILEAAHVVHRDSTLADHVETALLDLRARTGHTGYISVLDGTDVLALRVFLGTHALRVVTVPGTRSPAWATSTGRVLLSRLSPKARQRHLPDNFGPAGVNAPTALAELDQRLEQIHQRGWSHAIDEAVPGVASVSCCVTDPMQNQTMAFCLSFPAALATDEEIERVAALLTERARKIGRAIADPHW